MVVEEDGLVTFSGIAVSDEAAEELGDDTYGVTVSDAGYFTLSTSYPSAVKSYKVTVGGKAYTLLVVGDMEAVSQAAAIVKRIFPMVLGITLLIAFFWCHSGFLVSGTADSSSVPGCQERWRLWIWQNTVRKR